MACSWDLTLGQSNSQWSCTWHCQWFSTLTTQLHDLESCQWVRCPDPTQNLLSQTLQSGGVGLDILFFFFFFPVQFSSVALCDPMDCSMPGFPVHHQLPELAQTHVHRVGDAIQPSHPLSSPSPPALNLLQHQDLSQWVSPLYQVARVLELPLQHQFFQWIFRTDFL